MQNRYVGDIGDFGKIGLLKSLFNNANDNLGIIWYLFPDESHNNDGRHIDYLNNEQHISCDKELATSLSKLIDNNRTISSLGNCIQVSNPVTFYSNLLNFHQQFPTQKKIDKLARASLRQEWLVDAKSTVKQCNAIFLDPDNGLEIASCSKISQIKAGKFAYYNEIKELFSGKNTCVIYHHLNRNAMHHAQIAEKCQILRERINPDGTIYALRYKPYSPRAYFILTNKISELVIKDKISNFLSSKWGHFWDSYYEN